MPDVLLHGDELYLPGTTLDLQFLAEGCNTFEPLAVTVPRRFEPFICAAVPLVQRHSDNEKTILKLADRRLGYRGGRFPWKDICNTPYVKPRRAWRPTGLSLYAMTRTDLTPKFGRIGCGRFPPGVTSCRTTTLGLLHTDFCSDRKAGTFPVISASFAFVLPPESTTLHPITDIVQGLAERISSHIMEALRAIEAENCVLHNVIHIGNVVLLDGNRSPVVIDFGQADIREPELGDEEWSSAIRGGPDTHRVRNLLVNPEDGPWKRIVTLYEMSDPQYKNPMAKACLTTFIR
ncbi:hypothetical protein ARMGADRAFT_1084632 [Armillaria gallica]|uniref:Protein kinase domain-containing protein n=1 Tax=Armillaria gallica TaxID=47427 RepID=A0A2H3CZ88_ARMGA|nr:hypothetical protein ARMGADRAFT_1084632 [Armillaria gallica]